MILIGEGGHGRVLMLCRATKKKSDGVHYLGCVFGTARIHGASLTQVLYINDSILVSSKSTIAWYQSGNNSEKTSYLR